MFQSLKTVNHLKLCRGFIPAPQYACRSLIPKHNLNFSNVCCYLKYDFSTPCSTSLSASTEKTSLHTCQPDNKRCKIVPLTAWEQNWPWFSSISVGVGSHWVFVAQYIGHKCVRNALRHTIINNRTTFICILDSTLLCIQIILLIILQCLNCTVAW